MVGLPPAEVQCRGTPYDTIWTTTTALDTASKLPRALHRKVKGAPGCCVELPLGRTGVALQSAAPVADLEAPAEVGEARALLGRAIVVGLQLGTLTGAEGATSLR